MTVKAVSLAVAFAVLSWPAFASTKSDYDKEYDFSKLKTFDFKMQHRVAKDPLGQNGLWERRIEQDLVADLQKQGFERSEHSTPDFLVAYYMGTKERVDTRYLGYGFPGRWGWRHRGWFGWPSGIDVWEIPYTESTLVVDVIDARTNQLVWRGYDTDNIDLNKSEKTIAKAVETLVERFTKESREKTS